MRKLCLHVVVEARDLLGFEALHVLVQRIHVDRERQLALELGRRPGEDEMPAQLRTSAELREQARLTDPGLSHELDCPEPAAVQLVERLLKRIEFDDAPD
jgi:hypothetical protein